MTTDPAAVVAPDAAAATPISVLLAEDDAAARRALSMLLGGLGFHVVAEVGSGQQAIAQAKALRPDAVLLDVRMTDGTGIEAAQAITGANPGIAIVLLSADASVALTDREVVVTSAVALLPTSTPPALLATTLRLAVARARDLRSARADAALANTKLVDRKLIERAKGILMRRTGASEQEAYRILQRSSQDRSLPMVRIAQTVLASEPDAVHATLHEVKSSPPPVALPASAVLPTGSISSTQLQG